MTERYLTQPEIAAEPPFQGDDLWPVTVLALLTRLVRRKWLLARAGGLGLVMGVAVSLLLPRSYTATTRIMTPQQTPSAAGLMMNQGSGASGGQLAMAAAGGLNLRNPNDLYIGLLQSRPVADAILEQFGLRRLYHANDGTVARRKLAAHTSILSEKSTLLSVAVTDHDAQRAAAMANAYTEQLRLLTKTLALSEASHRRMFYEEQLKHAKDDVVAAELAFRQIEQKKGLVQLDAQAKAMIATLAALHAQVSAKQVELEALRSYSTEQNPEVQLSERQLRALEQEVAELEQRQQHGSAAGSSELGLQDVAGAGLEYLRAEHELQYRQILFDLLLKQYDVARLDEAKDAAVVQVVEAAIPPDRASSPGRGLITLGFTGLGILAACGYLLLADWARNHPQLARSASEFRSVLFSR
jgi:uncharacterized protein involved in exopolysaccharide biosynthesis